MKQERVIPARPRKAADVAEAQDIAVEETDAGLLNDIDELLDEIDAVLEEQSVLVNYRQRSGE
jgi:hypothetical protein